MKAKILYIVLVVSLIFPAMPAYASEIQEPFENMADVQTEFDDEVLNAQNHMDGYAKIVDNVLVSNNRDANVYSTYVNHPMHSYLTVNKDGSYIRVEYIQKNHSDAGTIYIEHYSKDLQLLSHKTMRLELPIWGGFYDDGTYFYLAFGQENYEELDDKEVIRIVKYDRNWNRLAAAKILGKDICNPFSGSVLRMDEEDGILYGRTSRTMYKSSDGLNHQAVHSFTIKTSDMSVQYNDDDYQTQKYGQVSHCFNSFVVMDNGDYYALDHGDANPRGAQLFKRPDTPWTMVFKNGNESERYSHAITLLRYLGAYGANYTGAMIGGFAVSDTHCISVGSSRGHKEVTSNDGYHLGYDAYITATNKKTIFSENTRVAQEDVSYEGDTKIIWLTDFALDGNAGCNNPQLVEINKNLYALFWQEVTGDLLYYTEIIPGTWQKISRVSKVLYLDGTGTPIGSAKTIDANFSDCQPIYDKAKNQIIWYVTDGNNMTFYQFNVSSKQVKQTIVSKTRPISDFFFKEETLTLGVGDSYSLVPVFVPENTTDEKNITYKSGNEAIVKVDENGKIQAVGVGRTYVSGMRGYINAETDRYETIYRDILVTVTEGSGNNPSNWPFTDVAVKPGNWKYEAVKYVYDNKIMNGVGDGTRFDPDAPLTREMFATVLYRMAGEPAVTYKRKFPDVPGGKWYSNAVIWASEQGIVSGYGSGNFGTGHYITREQISKMLMEYGDKQGYDVSQSANFNSFADAGKVSGWAKDYMKWAVGSGMIGGSMKNGKYYLNPQGNATRAECATMLKRFMEKYQ